MAPKGSNTRQVEPLWEPAVILPVQFVDRRGLRSPEASLMSAVLEDAFLCVSRNVGAQDRRRCRELRDASEWFSSQRRDWPFTFLRVCDTLGLDAGAVRQRVAVLIAQHNAAEPTVSPSRRHRRLCSGLELVGRSDETCGVDRPTRFSPSKGKPESTVGNSQIEI